MKPRPIKPNPSRAREVGSGTLTGGGGTEADGISSVADLTPIPWGRIKVGKVTVELEIVVPFGNPNALIKVFRRLALMPSVTKVFS